MCVTTSWLMLGDGIWNAVGEMVGEEEEKWYFCILLDVINGYHENECDNNSLDVCVVCHLIYCLKATHAMEVGLKCLLENYIGYFKRILKAFIEPQLNQKFLSGPKRVFFISKGIKNGLNYQYRSKKYYQWYWKWPTVPQKVHWVSIFPQ